MTNFSVQNVKVGDEVFHYNNYGKYPTVKKVIRATNNFVFIGGKNALGEEYETKFRRDGTAIDKFDGRLCTFEPGDVEKMEANKRAEKRIIEIINLLNDKGFKFTGYPQWYPIEKWEQLASAVS